MLYFLQLTQCVFIVFYIAEVSGLLISSFISLYSFNTLFIKTSLPWLKYKSTKKLEIRTLNYFEISFPGNTILSCFFFFFIIDLYFLILAVIAQIFNSTAKLVIPTGTQTNETNAEIESQPVIFEAKISKFST